MEPEYTTWRLAAAIAYHLPGAGILVHNDAGRDLLIAPTTVLQASMHPGELRDILGLGDAGKALGNLRAALNLDDDALLEPEVITLSPVLADCGLGLYRIGGPSLGGAFTFATHLDGTATSIAIRDHAAITEGTLDAIVRAGLGYDELLGVTMAVFEWDPGTSEALLTNAEYGIRAAQSACAVEALCGELEHNPTLDR